MNRNVLIINCVLAIAFIAGCGWIPKAQYKRQVNLTVPAGQGQNFAAETHNGNITIKGSDTTDCNLTATITVKADTEENAKKIAEQVKIDLIPEANNINVRIEKPDTTNYVQISVGLDANLPAGMNLSLKTHNGEISSSGAIGQIEASSHNGNIAITGALADFKFETHNGNVAVNCTKQSSKPCNISIETHNGDIGFTSPGNFSAAVDVSIHNGSIRTDMPLTVTGENDKIINGVVGGGRDKLHLKTHNGSIKIK
jgi:DUF4097 and DUF4098 domain-containing protein YvlB